MTFRILVVCTANICRSPLAERLLRAKLGSDPEIVVESAGTAALTGYAMDDASARALAELGGDGSGHVAQPVTRELIAAADLILTATSQHRATILQSDPLAFRRTFTLREFGRVGAQTPPASDRPSPRSKLVRRVGEVAAGRGFAEPAEPGGDEVGDPYGAPYREVQASARQIEAAVDGVLAALGKQPAVAY